MTRILVPLFGDAKDSVALSAAGIMAKNNGGLIDVRLFHRDPTSAVPLVGEGLAPSTIEQILGAAQQQIEQQVHQANASFETWCTRDAVPLGNAAGVNEIAANFAVVTGDLPSSIIGPARVSDLSVFVNESETDDSDRHSLAQAVLLDALRPLLLVPENLPEAIGKNIVIAWNGSAEARRAISMSYDVLRSADKVSIVTVGDAADPVDMAETLNTNGIAATPVITSSKDISVTDALNRQAEKLGADLIIIGAYSHNRMREFILGGVTKDLYGNVTIPTLMMH